MKSYHPGTTRTERKILWRVWKPGFSLFDRFFFLVCLSLLILLVVACGLFFA